MTADELKAEMWRSTDEAWLAKTAALPPAFSDAEFAAMTVEAASYARRLTRRGGSVIVAREADPVEVTE